MGVFGMSCYEHLGLNGGGFVSIAFRRMRLPSVVCVYNGGRVAGRCAARRQWRERGAVGIRRKADRKAAFATQKMPDPATRYGLDQAKSYKIHRLYAQTRCAAR